MFHEVMTMHFKMMARWIYFWIIDIFPLFSLKSKEVLESCRFIESCRLVSSCNILSVLFVCCLIHICVFTICAQHSHGLVELQGIEFLFCRCRFFKKLFIPWLDDLPQFNGGFCYFWMLSLVSFENSLKLGV